MLSWLLIHPADVIKVRMQLSNARTEGISAATGTSATPRGPVYRGVFHAVSTISRTEGVSAMYSGLTAALTRQVTYTTLRLGLYSSMRDSRAGDTGRTLSMMEKFGIGIVAGGVASAISTPVEVSMVRMYADGAAPVGQRRGYRNVGDALLRIAREEGVFGLWRGATPTIVRSMVVNCVQLGTYDQAKEVYGGLGVGILQDGVPLHIAASSTSGFCYSVATLPIDSAKTRLQNQRALPDGGFKYRNLGQTIATVAREESVLALWRGFLPYFSRCAGTLMRFFCLSKCNCICCELTYVL